MGWDWGPWVKWCLMAGGGTPHVCGFCLFWQRVWHRTLFRKSSTFIGVTLGENDEH